MASLNKVMLIGNLGKDPDVRYMPSGAAVTTFSIATNERWKDKQSGEDQEKVEWHRIVMFNKLAEIAAEYLKKGSSVYVEGKLQTRKWEKDGVEHWTTEVVAFQMQMLGKKQGGPPHPAGEGATTSRPQSQQSAPKGFEDDNRPEDVDTSGRMSGPSTTDFDDDIPF